MKAPDDYEILTFASSTEWDEWLGGNHADRSGVWIRLYKAGSAIPSVTHAEALTVALSYGWIDGQLMKHDDASWLRKFTPRRPKSTWSKRNREIVEQLAAAGKMHPAGLREVETAKADGRWDIAYDSPSEMTVPEDFLEEVAKNSAAYALFQTLNKANLYAIAWRLQTARKPETRKKRLLAMVQMLADGKTFH